MTYQYPWTSIGENIAYTWAGAANDPFMALVSIHWSLSISPV